MYVKQHSYELLFYNVELRLDGILFDYYSGILFNYYLHTFTKRVTLKVFTNVTIGIGDDIHIVNASARQLS